jgi:hypothetical protein
VTFIMDDMKKLTLRTLLIAPALLLALPSAALADDSASSTQAAPALEKSLNTADAAQEKAGSSAPENLIALKNKATAEVTKRQVSLTKWAGQLAAVKADCGQNAAAAARISSTQTSLVALNSQIQAATDLTAAKALYKQIFTHQRVYLVVSPVIHVAIACDNQTARANTLTTRLTDLQAKVTAAGSAGANTAAATALLAQVPGLIATGKTTAATAAASVAGLAPDQGVEATKTANAASVAQAKGLIKQADSSLDTAASLMKDASSQLADATRDDKRADKKAENQSEKAAREAAKRAEDAKRDAEKAAKKAADQAKKSNK